MTLRIAFTLGVFVVLVLSALILSAAGAAPAWFIPAAIGVVASCFSLHSAIRCRDLSDGAIWQPMIDRRLW